MSLWLLAAVAALDVAFAGFRAAQGRTGRWPTVRQNLVAAGRGLFVGAGLLVLPVTIGVLAVPAPATTDVATAMLLAVAPLAMLVLPALVVWALLPWRWGYLATALILGPGTWARPLVCAAAVIVVLVAGHAAITVLLAAWCTATLLVVEPIVGAWWYRVRDPLPSVRADRQLA